MAPHSRHERIADAGYRLLADFLSVAGPEHPYAIDLEHRGLNSYLNNTMGNGDLFQALLADDLSAAVRHADLRNMTVLHDVVTSFERYAVSDMATERTITVETLDRMENINTA
jgi:hypothetical protein